MKPSLWRSDHHLGPPMGVDIHGLNISGVAGMFNLMEATVHNLGLLVDVDGYDWVMVSLFNPRLRMRITRRRLRMLLTLARASSYPLSTTL
ncbi:unnamed protein product [Linum trigynum]|uniref:Uncharacterized protein n=1 Tax=Linum trigynum TaxID=586398 RepID=A0AAV2E092_9ROSI